MAQLETPDLDALAAKLKELRAAYDRYFAGLEKLEPLAQLTAFKKEQRRLLGAAHNNTSLRFRLQSLGASLLTYESHWQRLRSQIENGTFRRDRVRAQRLDAAPVTQPADGGARTLAEVGNLARQRSFAEDGPGAQVPDTAPGASVPPTSAARRPAAETGGDAALAALHRAYQLASPPGSRQVSLQDLADTVAKQTAAIKARYSCSDVTFRVEQKDGRPVLKATPR